MATKTTEAKKATKAKKSSVLPVLVVFLAWLVPGSGHVYVGHVGRGVIVFLAISALFWSGVAVGGVMTVDYESERWWFVAEMCTGVHGLVGWQRQKRVYEQLDSELAKDDDGFMDAVGRVGPAGYGQVRRAYLDELLAEQDLALVAPGGTVARAYAGVAGMLNILCIFDAMMLALMGRTGQPRRAKHAAGGRGDATT